MSRGGSAPVGHFLRGEEDEDGAAGASYPAPAGSLRTTRPGVSNAPRSVCPAAPGAAATSPAWRHRLSPATARPFPTPSLGPTDSERCERPLLPGVALPKLPEESPCRDSGAGKVRARRRKNPFRPEPERPRPLRPAQPRRGGGGALPGSRGCLSPMEPGRRGRRRPGCL